MTLKELQPLLKANQILASTLDIDKLLQVVLKLAARVVQAETGSLLLLDPKTNELVFNIALGDAGQELKTIRLKMTEGAAFASEEGGLVLANPAACRLFGFSERDYAGQNVWEALKAFDMHPSIYQLQSSRVSQVSFEGERKSGKYLVLAGMVKKIF